VEKMDTEAIEVDHVEEDTIIEVKVKVAHKEVEDITTISMSQRLMKSKKKLKTLLKNLTMMKEITKKVIMEV
jgi:beta-xylosidase